MERQITDNTMLDVAQILFSLCTAEWGQPLGANAIDFAPCHIRVPFLGRWLVKFTLKTEVIQHD